MRDGQTQLVNTNKLVRTYDGILGLKTGTTSAAGSCISAAAERNGVCVLIAVVLGAEKYERPLFGRIFAARLRLCKLEADDTGASRTARAARYGRHGERRFALRVKPPRGVLTASGGAEIGIKAYLPENVPAPVEPGDVTGGGLNGDTVQSLKITAKNRSARHHIFFRIAIFFWLVFFAAEAA